MPIRLHGPAAGPFPRRHPKSSGTTERVKGNGNKKHRVIPFALSRRQPPARRHGLAASLLK